MKQLIAKRKILYLSKEYQPGEELPISDSIMVAAWLQADSARWKGSAQSVSEKSSGKKGTG